MHPFIINIIWDYLNLGSCAQKEPSFQKNTMLSHSSNTIFAIEFSFNQRENQVVHAAIIDGVRSTDISAPVSLIRDKCIPALLFLRFGSVEYNNYSRSYVLIWWKIT